MPNATLIPTSHTAQQVGGLKRSKKFGALIEVGLTEQAALETLGVTFAPVAAEPETPKSDDRVEALVASGAFSRKEAKRIVEAQFFTAAPTPAAPVKAAPVVLTDKAKADALVTQAGLAHAKGRVYVTPEIVEALARGLKGGSPEIVQSSGKGKTAAVLIFREDSGDVAVQNLFDPSR